jgi:UDP-glucose 4-epimerase
MGMNVLVTGGAGFIGSHLAHRMVERGDSVRVFDDFSTGRRARLASIEGEVEILEGDLRDAEAVRRATRGIELVFHEAAVPSVQRSLEDPHLTTAVIAQGTLNVLVAARDTGVRRVIHASSSSVYGDEGELPRAESARPAPVSPYAVAKLAAEGLCATFSRLSGIETIALRYFNVYGPGQDPASAYAAAIPRFIRAIAANEPVLIYGDGGQSRDFTAVDDVVEANLLAAMCDEPGHVVLNVAGGRPSTVIDVAVAIGAALGRVPRYQHEPPRRGEVRDSWADLSEARRRLGYIPKTSLEDGLRRTIEAMQAGSDGSRGFLPSAGSRGGTPRTRARA